MKSKGESIQSAIVPTPQEALSLVELETEWTLIDYDTAPIIRQTNLDAKRLKYLLSELVMLKSD